ncbi:MAG: phenylalanine--tRNA ligase subunit alpha, partial [Desulfobacterales bacterium]
MEQTIEQIRQEALREIETAAAPGDIQAASIRYLGRKGRVTQYLRKISALPPDQRPLAGKKANEIKRILDTAFREA